MRTIFLLSIAIMMRGGAISRVAFRLYVTGANLRLTAPRS